ncbi:hypothetical protein HS088_TW12G00412 [Tripterygium wilfordii]|uniref:Ribosomal protein L34Ae n=1 Tax=Tripterygium wilfordii TaxID=458696 RepID=A0A7J7CYN6_TRIWF|nr:uncharacterized protein LOC120010270 [Tripterygium wilfordii]XP_038716947.1 uncharacterized protein LOC120010270 [Tripterygium wilfordii]XP_038716948.1 uncharacterized protein LOC120010270 [Tripterygium wilfordii]XP_038716949.1 uncharacterized protein LOC120010270 [Tripterygium wilfordii]XP_038716950.1 uncharacterized protein LOC120010270 [Tripterygium wilfordii]XP_038716951.1 uncharacterized protein LOC120010270 [Tripterygium wilfordii]XP_038716952.1 uncharacterized protein LOC120010270 [
MDFFRVKKFRNARKPDPAETLSEDQPVPPLDEPKNEVSGGENMGKSAHADPINEAEDDDDDFITNEVKRRLKELRRNSFMMLIPEEESCVEEEEEEEAEADTNPSEWLDVEAEGRRWWGGFDVVYDKYCERMLFFDRMARQQLNEAVSPNPSTPSPRSASKKHRSPLLCLSLKKIEEPDDETEHLQQLENDPYNNLETAYVAQICLTWEALHCQYTQLSQKISCQPESPTCYNHSAQQFQQFQVLLQRFIENEPFEQGSRAEIYTRARNILPKLLQVPNIQGSDQNKSEEEEPYFVVLACDLIRIIQSSVLIFHIFLKMDKKKSNGVRNIFGNQNQIATPLLLIQSSLEKKVMKLKEQRKKSKGWKQTSWPQTPEDVQLLFGLIDVKILSRVIRMVKITKEQLLWCEEKMKKLDLSNGKLQRDPSPILFPC